MEHFAVFTFSVALRPAPTRAYNLKDRLLPRSKWSNTETLEPNRVVDRNDKADPKCVAHRTEKLPETRASPNVESADPSRTNARTLATDPKRVNARMDNELPRRKASTTLCLAPNLAFMRTLKLEPICVKSSTDTVFPIRVYVFTTETALAQRAKLRNDNELPISNKPNTESVEPNRTALKTLRLEPIAEE
jgi:hypothetical protein